MSRVLVTGATGFIGSHLVEALVERGDEVTCLVRRTSDTSRLRSLDVRFAYGDVTRPETLGPAVDGQQFVYHLAGRMQPFHTAEFYQVNQQGTDNVARACARLQSPPLLVHTSTQAAAGPARDGRPLTEEDPNRPICHYGRSKLASEAAVRTYGDRLPATIVRPGIVFGPREPHFLGLFKLLARLGIAAAPVWPTLGMSLIHVEDLVELMLRAAENGARIEPLPSSGRASGKGVYFAVSPEHRLLADVQRMIGRAVGRRRTIVLPVPAAFLWPLALGGELLSQIVRRPPLFSFDRAREGTAGLWYCSPQAAEQELGFAVTASLEERFHQTAEWYRANGWM